jgi:Icc-related predicted phosphoesterase
MWFAELPAKAVVCIGGNHDFLLQQRAFPFANATVLEDTEIEVDGLRIYGSPWCPELSGFAYYATESDLIGYWRKIPSGIDILVTHTPPYGILDCPTAGTPNLGCPHLRRELERIKPRLHVFGHIHASFGSQVDDSTTYINAAVVAGRELLVRNPASVVHL